jgi:hypothetical protein
MRRNFPQIFVALLIIISVLALVGLVYRAFVYNPSQPSVRIYKGRVIDANTYRALRGAKVSVEGQELPQVYYTDSEGIFYLKMRETDQPFHIRIEANGYEVFDRNTMLSGEGLEEVHLTPLSNSQSHATRNPQNQVNGNSQNVANSNSQSQANTNSLAQEKTSSNGDEEEVRNVVRESQLYEMLVIYTNPRSFNKSMLDKYWVSANEGGKAAELIEASVRNLVNQGLSYGKESILEGFQIHKVNISPSGDRAEVETQESWYVPLYDERGRWVAGQSPSLALKPEYTLVKINGRWLILESSVPYRR